VTLPGTGTGPPGGARPAPPPEANPAPGTSPAPGPGREGAALRLARGLTRHAKLVVALWLVAVAVATPAALKLHSVLARQGASKVVEGTDSAAVEHAVAKAFPQRSERQTFVVLTAPDVRSLPVRRLLATLDAGIAPMIDAGQVSQASSAFTWHRDAALALVDATLHDLGADRAGLPRTRAVALVAAADRAGRLPPGTAGLLRSAAANPGARRSLAADFAVATDWRRFPVPVPSEGVLAPDGRTALVTVSFAARGADPDLGRLRALVDSVRGGVGSAVGAHVTGELALLQDTYDRAERDNAAMEQVAYLVIGLVLLLFFRAVLPALITVGLIGLTMNVSQAWLFLIGHQVTLTQFTVTIMTFVMLGAGVDYSMLLSSRYRQERVAGRSVPDAVAHATASAGESVLLAGTAVTLAFGATLLSPIDWIPPLGYGGLVGVPIILLAALTLTPALLMLLGDRFFWLGWKPLTDLERNSSLARYLRRTAAVARWCPIVVTLAFLVATIPLASVVSTHTLSADPVALSPDTDSRRGFDAVATAWGRGALFPTVVAGPLGPALQRDGQLTTAGVTAMTGLTRSLAAVPGVAGVAAATRPFGTALPAAQVSALPADVRRDYLAADGTARIVVQLRGDPFSAAARAAVAHLVDRTRAGPIAGLRVGGATRIDEQYGHGLRVSFWQLVTLVSVGICILLVVALRSVLIPVRLVATIMMSNVWAIAITVLIFQVWRHQAVINDLPVFLIILMMGLGMDYEIFLMTRVRDLVRAGAGDAEATTTAVVDTGRVITAAGLVMAGSLGAMTLSSTLMLQQYGTGLGSAVLLDATLVRILLVPASLLVFRRFNWWLPRLPWQPRAVTP
jgi:RND superfamily putative drug exporter